MLGWFALVNRLSKMALSVVAGLAPPFQFVFVPQFVLLAPVQEMSAARADGPQRQRRPVIAIKANLKNGKSEMDFEAQRRVTAHAEASAVPNYKTY